MRCASIGLYNSQNESAKTSSNANTYTDLMMTKNSTRLAKDNDFSAWLWAISAGRPSSNHARFDYKETLITTTDS